MKNFFWISTLFFVFLSAQASSISIICPIASEFNPPSKGSIYDYKYTATTYVDIPELKKKITLTGESDSSKAVNFQAATWTDQTFLCLYQGDKDVIVTYETVLMNYVSSCHFKNNSSECNANDPAACPLVCELEEKVNGYDIRP